MCGVGGRSVMAILMVLVGVLQIIQTNGSESIRLEDVFNTSTIRSGPVFLLDKRTIFISMFKYSHHGINNVQKRSRWLKALSGDGTSSTRFVDLHFIGTDGHVKSSPAELAKDYDSENVYLRLADNPDIGLFDAVVMVNHEDDIEARVDIVSSGAIRLADGNDRSNPWIENGTFVFRYPKCCPIGQYPGGEFCTEMGASASMSRVPIHEVKDEIFNSDVFNKDNITRRAFYYRPQCEEMFTLDQNNEVYMLMNGQLLSSVSHFACLDFLEDENGSMKEEIFMCAENNVMVEFSNKIYVGMMYFSSAVLLLWASVLSIILCKQKNSKAASEKIFKVLSIIYSVFFALHFVTLATAREIGIVSGPCRIVGYIYQFLLLASFTALFAMIFEGYYRVKNYRAEHSRNRLLIYTGICAVPIVTTMVSVLTNELTPSMASGQQREVACWFRSERKVYSYYVPIIIIMVGCLVLQIMTWLDMHSIRKQSEKDQIIFQMEANKFRHMFRLGAYLNFVMGVCWTMEVLSYYFEVESNFWFIVDAFNAMQGFLIFCAFAYHYFDDWRRLLAGAPKNRFQSTEMVPMRT